MKGQTGTSMQSIEYRKRKKTKGKLRECKNCIYLVYGSLKNIKTDETNKKHHLTVYPYYCEKKNTGKYYTTKIVCKYFKQK